MTDNLICDGNCDHAIHQPEHITKRARELALRSLVSCPTCENRLTITHPNATEREWLEGLREEPCPSCHGTGLRGIDAAARAICTVDDGSPLDEVPARLREFYLEMATAAIRAFLADIEGAE